MWCVMKCLPGEAQKVMESCKANLSRQALHDVFMFTCERMKRYQGSWHLETRQMFPDCLFLETEDPEQLARELEPYRAYACAGGKREMLQSVPPEAEDFLRRLCGDAHHLPMSSGYIRDGITHVSSGPLVGMERRIRKIDRHKRLADIAAPLHGMEAPVQAGLEIISKS